MSDLYRDIPSDFTLAMDLPSGTKSKFSSARAERIRSSRLCVHKNRFQKFPALVPRERATSVFKPELAALDATAEP